ncbi:hypothetical protein EVA_11983 [gut metagenome]|uniref:Uncharacterized protein n=1 Tax=gut metagenome TaxID=749906 RepID=J9FY50_9ZZZZ
MCRSLFYHLTAVHNSNIIGHLIDNSEVMGNEDDGCALFTLQVIHQAQNLRLNGNIQSGGRLVGNQDLGAACQCHGDHDALTHAAGQLMGILFHNSFGVRNLYVIQHL